ncbi:methyltransferase domain-containing protein [Deinococcus ruber]|uniref:RNA methyltransferase n=1 Tax=Deinococcus ruber TaxID=1848197 RepID=A0A918CHG4_9DEIO|nr:methyltransferase domain-containing protein [Deinococcus ruber]GGR25390.1 RNA methyltransferase [Deinococcus ruber]
MPRPVRSSSRSKNQKPRPKPLRYQSFELEALSGLEDVAEAELREVPTVRGGGRLPSGGVRFQFADAGGTWERLSRLRGAVAVYRVEHWDIPRPRAFLGHQVLGELMDFLGSVARAAGHQSFRLSAAGRDSETFTRLIEEIQEQLGLTYQQDDGEMLIRFRPYEQRASETEEGWEVLARITPRPLSARAWRACNMSGGLNATIAYAMHRLSGQRERDRIFNPMCGSGTLLIERSLMGPVDAMVGVDVSEAALSCARQNITAAKRNIEVAQVDALHTGLPDRSFDLVVADLPWGDAVGTHGSNAALYPAFLQEMDRLTARAGRLCLLTHEIKLFERVLAEQSRWQARELFQVYSGGHHPKCYLLSK